MDGERSGEGPGRSTALLAHTQSVLAHNNATNRVIDR